MGLAAAARRPGESCHPFGAHYRHGRSYSSRNRIDATGGGRWIRRGVCETGPIWLKPLIQVGEIPKSASKGSLDALRPELDVVGSCAEWRPLSGNINPAGAALTHQVPRFMAVWGNGTALGQICRNDFPTYSVGLQLTLPLRG